MSSGVTIRRQYTDTAENSASRVERAVAAAGVLEGAPAVERRRRLADQRQHRHPAGQCLAQPGTVFRQPPPEVAATTPRPAPLRL